MLSIGESKMRKLVKKIVQILKAIRRKIMQLGSPISSKKKKPTGVGENSADAADCGRMWKCIC